jgi:hypothetical protein
MDTGPKQMAISTIEIGAPIIMLYLGTFAPTPVAALHIMMLFLR